MSPLRWIQSTGPHWTVILEEVTSDTFTEVGGADGAIKKYDSNRLQWQYYYNTLSPASKVIAVAVPSLLPAKLDAVTVII